MDSKSWQESSDPNILNKIIGILLLIQCGNMSTVSRNYFHVPFFSECVHYKSLTKFDRAKGYMGADNCDRSLSRGWYRFQGLAGKQMPDSCVPKHRCGTHAPGWLRGGHPTVAEGAVRRKVCFHWTSGCCQFSTNIRVRNCGAFYVYRLNPPPVCILRYCGDANQGIF